MFANELLPSVILLLLVGPFIFAYRISFNIYYKAGLVVLHSFSFSLYAKILIFPSNLNESLPTYSLL